METPAVQWVLRKIQHGGRRRLAGAVRTSRKSGTILHNSTESVEKAAALCGCANYKIVYFAKFSQIRQKAFWKFPIRGGVSAKQSDWGDCDKISEFSRDFDSGFGEQKRRRQPYSS